LEAASNWLLSCEMLMSHAACETDASKVIDEIAISLKMDVLKVVTPVG